MHICKITLANGARFNALGINKSEAVRNCLTIWHLNSEDVATCDVKFYASHGRGFGTCKDRAPRTYEPINERGI